MTRSLFVDPRRCTGLPLLIALLGSVAASPATAAVIYQENFDGSGSTDLAGLVPDVAPGSQTWGGSTAFKADGFVNSAFAGIYLPFTPTPGLIYTLTGSFRVASGDWLGIGFSGGSPTSTVRFADNAGRGWVIAKAAEIQSFVGPATNGSAVQGTINPQSPAGTVTTQTITLDASSPSPANWKFSATQVIGSTSYTIWTDQPANITAASDITAIGLSSSFASGTFASFTLTSAVPEPSTGWLALAGLACGGCAVWRRLKRA